MKRSPRDGWLRTGDLGLIDSFGNLHIKGRSKSVIVLSNGENVYPEAIEHKIQCLSLCGRITGRGESRHA